MTTWSRGWMLAAILAASGCATKQVSVVSNPPGAMVRFDGQERRAPCTVSLPRGVRDITVALDAEHVQVVRTPDGPGPWDISVRVLTKAGAYTLYAVSAPFLVVGTASCFILSGSDLALDSGGDGDECLVVLAACAVGGLAIGMPLYGVGEYLDDLSRAPLPVVFVDFTPRAETANTKE